QGAHHHEVADFEAAGPDPGLGGAQRVAADGDRVQAPAGPGQQQVEGGHDQQAPAQMGPVRVPEPVPDGLGGVVGDRRRVGVGGHQDEADDDVGGAQGGD